VLEQGALRNGIILGPESFLLHGEHPALGIAAKCE